MGTVTIGDFPSYTNSRNFEFDMQVYLPTVELNTDYITDSVLINDVDYEQNKGLIDELVGGNGGRKIG